MEQMVALHEAVHYATSQVYYIKISISLSN